MDTHKIKIETHGKKIIFNMTHILMICTIDLLFNSKLYAQNRVNAVTINWNNTITISKTTSTLQLVENPMVRNSSVIHDKL